MTPQQKVEFSQAITKLLLDVLTGVIDETMAAQSLALTQRWLLGLRKPESGFSLSGEPEAKEPSMDDVRRVFEHWRLVTNRPTARMESHERIIRSALKRFTVDQLNCISSWASTDPGTQGHNKNGIKYDWPKNMFRNPAQIEELLERSGWSHRQQTVSSTEIDEAMEALERGDVETYNRLMGDS